MRLRLRCILSMEQIKKVVMRHLIILGAGGMGRQVLSFAKSCKGYGKEYDIKGFLDDNLDAMKDFPDYPPVLGTIDNYQIEADDVFFNSIGDIKAKKLCIQKILDRGGDFLTLIHPTAQVSPDTRIGKGCMLGSYVGIGVETTIGDFCLLQSKCTIGHDVIVGDFARIDCNVVLIAGVNVGKDVCVHTSSVVNHDVKLGDGSTVGAMSFVIKDVKPGQTVFGNPAKIIF